MNRIAVDRQGQTQGPWPADPTAPLLLYGKGLLSLPLNPELLVRLAEHSGDILFSTDQLEQPSAASVAEWAAAGLRAIEFPLPTANPKRHARLAGHDGLLEAAVAVSQDCFRQGVGLWVRVPLGAFNRDDLPALGRFVTNELMAVERVLFHCSGSLGRPPRRRKRGQADPLTGFPAALYRSLIELESARIWVGTEHRDGLPLCLFGDEPDPLRYFPYLTVGQAQTLPVGSRSAPWVHPQKAPPDQLIKPPICTDCALAHSCLGLHRSLEGQAGPGNLRPFAQADPAGLVTKPAGALYCGAARRLRGARAYENYWPPAGQETPLPPNRRLSISPDSMTRTGLADLRLEGFQLTLARLPWRGFSHEPVTPSLALTNLVPFLLRARATVTPIDFTLLASTDPTLAAQLTPEKVLRSDVAISASAPEPESQAALGTLAGDLLNAAPPAADLLALSLEVPGSLPVAQAVAREWKRRGGGPVVVGGSGMGDPRRLLEVCSELDFCVHGEGEVPLLLLCDALRGGRPLADVPGLIYRHQKDGALTHTPGVVHSLDLHAVPDLSGLALDGYDGMNILNPDEPVFMYQFIRGCPHSCAFCGEFDRWRFRVRSPDLVVRDLRFATEELGRRQFFFVNNMINVSRAHLEAWLDAMEPAKLELEWCDCARPTGMHRAQLQRLRGIGCRSLTWGLDILSPGLNKRLWKNLNLDRAAKLLADAQAAGIKNYVNVIVGMPTETEADVQATIDYLRRHAGLMEHVQIMAYHFRKDSPLGRWPARFGLRLGDQGVDELDGRTWAEQVRYSEETLERVSEAIGVDVPVL